MTCKSAVSGPKPSVLHINLARGWRGGEQQTYLLIKELAAAGYRQGLCANVGELLAADVKNIPGVAIHSPGECLRGRDMARRYDIAHAHEARAVYLAWWLKLTQKVPYIITRRMQQPPKRRVLTKSAYKNASALIGISSAACESVKRFCSGKAVKKIPSAHSNLEPDLKVSKEIRSRWKTNSNTVIIGHAGALKDSHKGQSVLIEAGLHLKKTGANFKIVFLGDGPDRNRLEKKSEELDFVQFEGHVTQIENYIAAMDLFVFPSHHEGLGSVLLDVMSLGVPIIATRVGGIPDIITNETGTLVDPNSANQIEGVIHDFMLFRERYFAIARKAKANSIAMSPSKMAEKYMSVYGAVNKT